MQPNRWMWIGLSVVFSALMAGHLWPQTATPPPKPAAGTPGQKKTIAPAKKAVAGPMTNKDVIRLLQAKISDDIIINKIKSSKTNFDTEVDGLVALKEAGASERLLNVIIDPTSATSTPPPAAASAPSATPAASRPALPPSQTGPVDVVHKGNAVAPRSPKAPRPVEISAAPKNYGVYVEQGGELKPLGRIQTKVQLSKFRTLLKSMVPFVRQKIDINVPGAHSTSRYEALRPNFYAFFPPSRDVSKFKLLQCKITGQNFDQRTLANASILFSTEQNQDEVLCDIGPTAVKDLYRISPREDLPTGEFGFVEGNTGSKSTSNIEIIDVYDFGVDRKEEKLSLKDYLNTLPGGKVGDTAFLTWTREDAKLIVADREGKTGITGSMMGWFKRQYASLDVYWADVQFARAFARLEMIDKDLTADQATKLCGLLLSPENDKYYVVVSIGGKIGSGKLIGANEGERLMRPFDASLNNNKSKDVVPAKRLEFLGGYAGLWKVTFDQKSIKGPVINDIAPEVIFEARLNQNLDFKAKFDTSKVSGK